MQTAPQMPIDLSMETNLSTTSESLLIEEVRNELRKQTGPGRSYLQNIRMLVASLIIFAGLGLFQHSVSGVAILVLVLLIHETGHLIGMKMFGYRDVQMFFVPFFGAAVSGVQKTASSTQHAIVALLGPIPGIVLGIISGFVFFRTGNDLYAEAASSFLFINGFNLLPFHPLDGGRVLDALLFSRHARVEVGFKFLTAMFLFGIGIFLHSVLLNCFAVFAMLSLSRTSVAAKIAGKIKIQASSSEATTEEIPDAQLVYVLEELKEKLRARMKDSKMVAGMVHDIWQRARTVPPGILSTAGILAVYLPFVMVGLLAPFVFDAGRNILQARTELKEVIQRDGTSRRVERKYVQSQKVLEVPVNEAGLYNGLQTEWHPFSAEKSREGAWKNGFRHGQWKSWDRQGRIESVVEYDMGRAVRYATPVSGSLSELPENQWPVEILNDAPTAPSGPRMKQTQPNGVMKTAVEQ